MKNYISLTVFLVSTILSSPGCDPKTDANLQCHEITLGKTFTARIGEVWCVPSTDWKITFGPMIEDSRCNVPNIECIWAGRYVMGATIDNGEVINQNFEAVNNWQDTLYSGPYAIYLNLVKPEIRPTTEPIDPASYSFDIIVK
jgi:hypothetical protein